MERARVHSWCTPNLQEVFSNLDKNHSRAIAEQAIPLLVSEINELQTPEEAVDKLHLMVGDPDVVQPFLGVLDMIGSPDSEDAKRFRQYIRQLISGDPEENSGSGS